VEWLLDHCASGAYSSSYNGEAVDDEEYREVNRNINAVHKTNEIPLQITP
jgi:hypothetical protein